jgi:hypothetical protein
MFLTPVDTFPLLARSTFFSPRVDLLLSGENGKIALETQKPSPVNLLLSPVAHLLFGENIRMPLIPSLTDAQLDYQTLRNSAACRMSEQARKLHFDCQRGQAGRNLVA